MLRSKALLSQLQDNTLSVLLDALQTQATAKEGSMYADFRQDGWPLCPRCKEDELYSVLLMKSVCADPKPSIAQCMRDVMCCYRCGWCSDEQPRRTLLGHPYIVTDDWPPRMVFPNEARNKSGHIEIHGRAFDYSYSVYFDSVLALIPLGPQIADADLFV